MNPTFCTRSGQDVPGALVVSGATAFTLAMVTRGDSFDSSGRGGCNRSLTPALSPRERELVVSGATAFRFEVLPV